MLGMTCKDTDHECVIESALPMVGPRPVPPWLLKPTLVLNDDGVRVAMEAEAGEAVAGPLRDAVARWRESDPLFLHARQVTEALGQLEQRLEAARSDVVTLNREIDAALLNGRSAAVDERVVKASSAHAEVAYLTERKDKLAKEAAAAKDAAEAAFCTFLKAEAVKVRRDADARMREAGEQLCQVAAEPLRRLIVAKKAAALADPRFIDGQYFQQALAGIRPDGFAQDRRLREAMNRTREPVPATDPPHGRVY